MSGHDFTAIRVTAAGVRDAGFGTSGVARAVLGSGISAGTGVGARLSDGKLIALGSRNNYDLVYTRYTTAGAVDSGPTTALPTGGPLDVWTWRGCAVLSDDTAIIGGEYTNINTAAQSGRLVKIDANGAAVAGWSQGANPYVDFEPSGASVEEAMAVAVDAAGRAVVAGSSNVGGNSQVFVLRFTPAGALDTSFGTGGIALVPRLGASGDIPHALRIGADGRIVVVASKIQDGVTEDTYFVRLNP